MGPYDPDDHVNQLEEPLTPEQLAKTWVERIKEDALMKRIENDIAF